MKNRRRKEGLSQRVLVFIWMLSPVLMIANSLDNDTYYLLQTGNYILKHGLPTIEPFTMHDGLEFSVQQWLSCVLFAVLFQKFGKIGLILLAASVFAAHILVIRQIIFLLVKNHQMSYMLAFVYGIFLSTSIVVRPWILSELLFLIEILQLERYSQSNKKKYLYGLPIISLLLVNLHASLWFGLFVFAMPFLFEHQFLSRGSVEVGHYRKLPIMVALIISFAIGFLNPYGLRNMLYLVGSTPKSSFEYIQELFSSSIRNVGGIYILFSLGIVGSLGLFGKDRILVPLRYLFLYIGTLLMSAIAIRNIVYFEMATILFLANCLQGKEILNQAITVDFFKKKYYMILVVLTICLVSYILGAENYLSISEADRPEYLNELEQFASQYELDGRTAYTEFDFGSYAEILGLRSYIDCRMEVFTKAKNKKEDIWEEYVSVLKDSLDEDAFIDKYQFDYMLIYNKNRLIYYVRNRMDYELIQEGEIMTIFRRIDGMG